MAAILFLPQCVKRKPQTKALQMHFQGRNGRWTGNIACVVCTLWLPWTIQRAKHICVIPSMSVWLTHWGRDKMASISQTTLSNAFSWMKMLEFRFKFHSSLFLRVQFTIFQHWFREWLGADQATSHYLNQWWPSSTTPICVTRPQWVNHYGCKTPIDQYEKQKLFCIA